MVKKYFLLSLLFSIAITSVMAQIHIAPDSSKLEDKVMKIVFALPEVKELIDQNKSQKNKYPVVGQFRRKPGRNFKYYWVGVGIDDEHMFTTYLHFYVNPKTFAVSYFDVMHMQVIPIEKWRANKSHNKEYYNPH